MKYLLVALVLSFPTLALAKEGEAIPVTECAAVLAAPPFVDILTRNEGKDFSELNPLYSGRALLGLECSVDELTDFFENSGWEFLDYEEWRSLVGPVQGNPGNSEYYVDASASYCLKRPTLFEIFDYRCRPIATIAFHEGRISHIIAHTSK